MTRGKDLGPLPKRDTKATVRHKMKIEMYKYCAVWGFGEKQSIEYFKDMGEKLSHQTYYDLKTEFESQQSTNDWYSDMALVAMESTHRHSVLQLDELIKTAMHEIRELTKLEQSTDYWKAQIKALDVLKNKQFALLGEKKIIFKKTAEGGSFPEETDLDPRDKSDILGKVATLESQQTELESKISHNRTSKMVLASMMKTLSDLIKTRDDMLAATPVVQAIMNKAAMEKEKTMVKA